MLTTVNYYLYYKCESRHYSAAEKKAFLCFKHWILLSEKKFKVFFGVIVLDILKTLQVNTKEVIVQEREGGIDTSGTFTKK